MTRKPALRRLYRTLLLISVLPLAPGLAHAGVLRQDLRGLLTCRNLGLAALGFGAAGVAHRWDDDLKGRLKGVGLFEATSTVTDGVGSGMVVLPGSLGLWVLGKAARRPELEAVSFDLLRALVITQAAVSPIKYGVRRARPDHSNRLSFPSGHAANVFAVAGVLNRRYGPRAGVPLMLLGALVGAGRMKGDRHFLSDVVAGATVGAIVGHAITRTGSKRVSLLPVPGRKGWMLAVLVRD